MDDMADFSLIVQLSRRELVHVLESIPGSKDLVVEAGIMRPLDKVANMTVLLEHGCSRVQQLKVDGTVLWNQDLTSRVFMCRPEVVTIRKVAEIIRSDPTYTYHVVLVDRKRNICELELERHGVHGQVVFHELNLYAIPLETDIFSLELPTPTIRSSFDPMPSLARAIWQLQCLYGVVPVTYGLGVEARTLDVHLKQLCSELGEPPASADRPISHLLVISRELDLVSVLMTGLTYESLLNDCFEYSCGKIQFGDNVMSRLKNRNNNGKSKTVTLNNSDVIFSAIRNKHMTSVFPFLSSKAKTLQSSYDKANAMSKINEIKSFVTNELKSLREQHKLLEVHICACEVVLETTKATNERFVVEHSLVRGDYDPVQVTHFLECLMCRQHPMWKVLQVMCLWSVVNKGIPSRHFASLRNLFLQSYGSEHLTSLFYLKQAGLLYESSTAARPKSYFDPPDFAQMSKALDLTNKPDEASKSGASYVFSDAYTPVAARILELLVGEGWESGALKRALPNVERFCSNPSASKPDQRIRKAIMVCFPSGITYAEVAALRRFAQDYNFRVIMVTTHIINRDDFIRRCTDE